MDVIAMRGQVANNFSLFWQADNVPSSTVEMPCMALASTDWSVGVNITSEAGRC